MKQFLPGLNGLRAIAALAVIYSHVNRSLHLFDLPQRTSNDLAEYGVTLFFALSGFLITWLLIREKNKTNTVSIRKFYLRRILRIWPLYFFYLLLILIFLPPLPYEGLNLAYYVFFAPNAAYVLGLWIPNLTHYWSLGVEEQFYLFWPWLIRSTRNYIKVLIGFVILFFMLKLGARLIWGGDSVIYEFIYVTRFDCMGIGALGAVIFLDRNEWVKRLSHKSIQLVCWIFMAILFFNAFDILGIINHEIVAIWSVFMIFHQVSTGPKWIDLERPVLNYLGKISFGLYVYHPLAIAIASFCLESMVMDLSLKYGMIYSLVFLLTIVFAHVSYTFLESPFLRIKGRFSVV